MPIELNCDSFEIKNYEMTEEGYLRFWLVGGIPGKELIYDGGNRKEKINKDALFDNASLDTAVGKPIRLNHPPRAINSHNYRENTQGVVLQEFAEDDKTGALVLAGIVHDAKVVDGIMKGKYKYVSAGYKADKKLNTDGVLIQSNRRYDHFAVLSEDYVPRGGSESKVLILDDSSQNNQDSDSEDSSSDDTQSFQSATSNDKQPAKTTTNNDADMKREIAERVELFREWGGILEENNLTIDYNADAVKIKRQVLSIYYPEKTMRLINASNIDGVWIGFTQNYMDRNLDAGDDDFSQSDLPAPLKSHRKRPTPASSKAINFDSAVEDEVEKFRKKMEAGKSA